MSRSLALVNAAPTLPGELTDRIVDFLHDDWRALVACALTDDPAHPDSLLTPSAMYHLSHEIVLHISEDSSVELPDFVKAFPPASHLAMLVHSIHICGPLVSEGEAPQALLPLPIDLSHLPNLGALTLSHLLVDSPARLIRFMCELPALQELSFIALSPSETGPQESALVPPAGPSMEDLMARLHRLKILRVVDVETCGHRSSSVPRPAVALLKAFDYCRRLGPGATPREVALSLEDHWRRRQWVEVVCARNAKLQHAEVTLTEAVGLGGVSATRNLDWDSASSSFIASMRYLLSHPSLRLRYDPWCTLGAVQSASRMIDVFLAMLSTLSPELRPVPGRSYRVNPPDVVESPALESLELVLRVPPDARANTAAWTNLLRALDSGCWSRLVHTKIVLEPLTPSALVKWRSQPVALVAPSAREHDVDAVETYAAIVRGAAATHQSETRGGLAARYTVEVVVRNKLEIYA